MVQSNQLIVKCDACGHDTKTYVLVADYKLCPLCEADFDKNMERQHEESKDTDTK